MKMSAIIVILTLKETDDRWSNFWVCPNILFLVLQKDLHQFWLLVNSSSTVKIVFPIRCTRKKVYRRKQWVRRERWTSKRFEKRKLSPWRNDYSQGSNSLGANPCVQKQEETKTSSSTHQRKLQTGTWSATAELSFSFGNTRPNLYRISRSPKNVPHSLVTVLFLRNTKSCSIVWPEPKIGL